MERAEAKEVLRRKLDLLNFYNPSQGPQIKHEEYLGTTNKRPGPGLEESHAQKLELERRR